MSTPDPGHNAQLPADPVGPRAIRAAYRAANADLLRQRIDMGVALFSLTGFALLFQEWAAYQEQAESVGLIFAGQVLICVAALSLARWQRVRERLPAIGALLASAIVGTVFVEDVLLGLSPEVITIGLVSILSCTAALFPWGWRAQCVVSGVCVLGLVGVEVLGLVEPVGAHAYAGLMTVAAATVAGALLVGRYRFAAFQRAAGLERVSRANREEADIAAALVEVGHTLAAVVGNPDVFDRVNRLIAELLGCDWSGTVTLDPERRVYRVVGLHGVSAEIREQAESMEFPEESFPLLRKLEDGGMVEVQDASANGLVPAAFFEKFRVSAALAAPIVLGGEVVGVVTNGYAEQRGPFSRRHRRITAGIAQATAIAVENQRLFNDLTRANRVKSDFVSTMSHELRTPVNVMLGFARVLEEGDAGELSGEQRDIVRRIRRSGLRLGELVDAILDLSKLESSAERVKLDWVELDSFLADLEEEFAAEAEEAAVHLEWQNLLDGRRILTEERCLKTILRHLVRNAVKFAPRGEVRVEIAQSAASLVLIVSDSGIGIAPEDVESIFQEFHQIDATDSREFGGVGLGLHIVHRLVERLGGSVAVVSEPGRGSDFTVEIPAQFARARGA
ncbi:MAG: HAMP domain-containing sensor histidine kinase [Candidatus Binatia bacterium]|nr:HAMP domain-containing sensor histidine kinase [Candidatus Binatia bacterium]